MKTEDALIYLAACAVNNKRPEAEIVMPVNVDELFALAFFHQVTALICEPLKILGIEDARFRQELITAVWRNCVTDTETDKVLSGFEKAGIRYMPLKGSIIKHDYPKPEYRQMVDVDILVDEQQIDRAVDVMTQTGFEQLSFDIIYHISFGKKPICMFEIHRYLFPEQNPSRKVFDYYKNIFERLEKDTDNQYGYHFSPEDFYLYMVMHEYKHFAAGGAGLRSLLDTYVFLKKHHKELDWNYIREEIRKLGAEEFEKENRTLALSLLNNGMAEELTAEEKSLLKYYLTSGAAGTEEHDIQNKVRKAGLIRYILQRVFLPMDLVKLAFPFFYRHKILLPFLPLYRVIKLRKNMAAEIRLIRGALKDKPKA